MPSSHAQAIRDFVKASFEREGTLYAVLQEQYKRKKGRPVDRDVAWAELMPFRHLPEQEALAAFVEYSVFKEIRAEADTALLEQAIRRGLQLLTLEEREILKKLDAAGYMFHWGALFEAMSDVKPVTLIRHIKWGIGKDEVRQMFSGKQPLAVEPAYDEIGFFSPSYGLPACFFFCFRRGTFGSDKLARAEIHYFPERPPDADVERAYIPIRKDLVAEYGQPRELPCAKNAPAEFRHSQLLVWILPDSVLTLSCGLLRDEVPADNSPIGVGYGDRKRDPFSQAICRSNRGARAGAETRPR